MTGNEEAQELVISSTSSASLDRGRETAERYAAEARSEATRRAYRKQWRAFSQWMASKGVAPLPCPPELVAIYLAERAEKGARVSTLAQFLAALTEAHRMSGHDSPRDAPVVREVWKGIKRRTGTSPRQVAPLLPDDLRALVRSCSKSRAGLRDRALLCVGFAGAFRRSEIVALTLQDVEFVDEGVIISLRRSKTDQEGAGEKVGVPFGSHRDTCPVRSLRAWIDAAKITEGPLFRSVSKHGHIGGQLDGRDVARLVKRRATAAGLDATRFSGHSLRAGLATAAARAGRTDRAIMRQGRWRSRATVDRYVREATLFDENAAAGIGL